MAWNEADAKSLFITIGGTILGGLVLVMILGLTLIFSRYALSSSTNHFEDVVLCLVIIVLSLLIVWKVKRGYRPLGAKAYPLWLRLLSLGLAVIAGLFCLLIVVGAAAGIKA